MRLEFNILLTKSFKFFEWKKIINYDPQTLT